MKAVLPILPPAQVLQHSIQHRERRVTFTDAILYVIRQLDRTRRTLSTETGDDQGPLTQREAVTHVTGGRFLRHVNQCRMFHVKQRNLCHMFHVKRSARAGSMRNQCYLF